VRLQRVFLEFPTDVSLQRKPSLLDRFHLSLPMFILEDQICRRYANLIQMAQL